MGDRDDFDSVYPFAFGGLRELVREFRAGRIPAADFDRRVAAIDERVDAYRKAAGLAAD